MGPKNSCSYADLAMGVIDQKAKSGTIKPRLWWHYRDDIFVDALGKHPLCHRMCKVTKETSGANKIMRNAIDSTSITF